MKNILLIFVLSFLLFSCSFDNGNNQKTNSGNISEVDKSQEINNKKTNSGETINNKEKVDTNSGTTQNEENSEYCVLNECLPNGYDYEDEGEYYTLELNHKNSSEINDINKEIDYKISKEKDFFEKKESLINQGFSTKIHKKDNLYIKINTEYNCGGGTRKQSFYDKNGKKLDDFIYDKYSKSIYIGNIEYEPSLVYDYRSSVLPLPPYKIEYIDETFESIDNFIDFVYDKVINEEKKLYKSYIAEYEEHPGIKFKYTSKGYDGKSLRVVWLGTDKNYISENIQPNGDYLDLKITNKIIGYYDSETNHSLGIFDNDGNRIESIDESDMPFFKMRKLDNDGNYIVYLKEGYEVIPFAEMCKPVVYYYSDKEEKNKLTLKPKKGDYFTKLIPALDNNNSWSFSANNGKINIDNKKYDYLYYSMVNVGYEHNKDGWIVKGSNIVDFFDDKLDKINFNSREKTDFIDYWKTEYEADKYYFVSFKYKEDLDKIIELNFSNKIDNEFRVLLDSYEVLDFNYSRYEKFLYSNVGDKFDNLLIQRFDRGNYSNEVFEWGGVLVKKNETITK